MLVRERKYAAGETAGPQCSGFPGVDASLPVGPAHGGPAGLLFPSHPGRIWKAERGGVKGEGKIEEQRSIRRVANLGGCGGCALILEDSG